EHEHDRLGDPELARDDREEERRRQQEDDDFGHVLALRSSCTAPGETSPSLSSAASPHSGGKFEGPPRAKELPASTSSAGANGKEVGTSRTRVKKTWRTRLRPGSVERLLARGQLDLLEVELPFQPDQQLVVDLALPVALEHVRARRRQRVAAQAQAAHELPAAVRVADDARAAGVQAAQAVLEVGGDDLAGLAVDGRVLQELADPLQRRAQRGDPRAALLLELGVAAVLHAEELDQQRQREALDHERRERDGE